VKLAGVKRALAWAHSAPRGSAPSHGTDGAAVRAIDRAAQWVPGSTCLVKSLALTRLLRGGGRAAEVRFGTLREEPFAAHAWVELDGLPLTSPRGAAPLPADRR
jgi:hypothetical protein